MQKVASLPQPGPLGRSPTLSTMLQASAAKEFGAHIKALNHKPKTSPSAAVWALLVVLRRCLSLK